MACVGPGYRNDGSRLVGSGGGWCLVGGAWCLCLCLCLDCLTPAGWHGWLAGWMDGQVCRQVAVKKSEGIFRICCACGSVTSTPAVAQEQETQESKKKCPRRQRTAVSGLGEPSSRSQQDLSQLRSHSLCATSQPPNHPLPRSGTASETPFASPPGAQGG